MCIIFLGILETSLSLVTHKSNGLGIYLKRLELIISKIDVLFINADSSAAAYQSLAIDFAAIEPPTWSLLLANSMRAVGFSCAILDATAEGLSHEQSVQKVIDLNPRLAVFVVYGQNPNSGRSIWSEI